MRIYALKDEGDNIRYIGRTVKSLDKLVRDFITYTNSVDKGKFNRWLRGMRNRKRVPTVELLEEVTTEGKREVIKYIKKYTIAGCKLVNNIADLHIKKPMMSDAAIDKELKELEAAGLVKIDWGTEDGKESAIIADIKPKKKRLKSRIQKGKMITLQVPV